MTSGHQKIETYSFTTIGFLNLKIYRYAGFISDPLLQRKLTSVFNVFISK